MCNTVLLTAVTVRLGHAQGFLRSWGLSPRSPVVPVAGGLHRHVRRPSAAGPAVVSGSQVLAVLLSSSLMSRTVDSGSCRIYPVPADRDAKAGRRRLSSLCVSPCPPTSLCLAPPRRPPASRGLWSSPQARPDPAGLRDVPEPRGWGGWGTAPSCLGLSGAGAEPPAVPGWRPCRLLRSGRLGRAPQFHRPPVGDPRREASLWFGRCFIVYLVLISKCSRLVSGWKVAECAPGASWPLRSAATCAACAPGRGLRLSPLCQRHATGPASTLYRRLAWMEQTHRALPKGKTDKKM